MSTVEAAASLFGPEDLADPFASLGANHTEPTTNTSDLTTNEAQPHHVPDASGLFDADPEAPTAFSTDGYVSSETSQYGPFSEASTSGPYDHPSTHSQDLSTGDSYYGGAQGWYDEHGQWHTHDNSEVETPAAQGSYGAYDHTVTSNPYDPYAPQATSHSTSTHTNYAPPPNTAYSAYEPSALPGPHSSSTQLSTSSIYDPYKAPESQFVVPPTSSPYNTYSNQMPIGENVPTAPAIPPTARPSAAPFRPKTLNAYDPPLPPPKPLKRMLSRPIRSISPAVGQQTYPIHDSFASPPAQGTHVYAPPSPSKAAAYESYNHPISGVNDHPETRDNWNSVTHGSTSNGYAVTAHSGGYREPYDHNLQGNQHLQHMDASGLQKPASRSPPPPSSTYIQPTNAAVDQPTRISVDGQTRLVTTSSNSPNLFENQFPADAYKANSYMGDTQRVSITQDGLPPKSPLFSAPLGLPSNGGPSHAQSSTFLSGRAASLRGPPIIQRGTPDVLAKPISPPPSSSHPRTKSPYEPRPQSPLAVRTRSPDLRDQEGLYESKTGRISSPVSEHIRPRPQNTAHTYVPRRNSGESGPSSEYRNNSTEGVSSPTSTSPRFLNRPASAASAPRVPNRIDSISETYQPTVHNGERAASPGSASVHSLDSASRVLYESYAPQFNHTQSTNIYQPSSTFGHEQIASPVVPRSRNGSQSVASDSYSPASIRLNKERPNLHGRSWSNGSSSSASPTAVDPYAPSHHSRKEPSHISSHENYSSASNHPSPYETGLHDAWQNSTHDLSTGQEISLLTTTHAAYAPSPSLLGSNDPLGRISARIPVFSFGFGGKVVTCFHGSSVLNTGFDVALSSRHANDVQIRVLHRIIPESALETSAAAFPGPLFADPGTPTTTSLVRTGASQTKAKKARLIKYLDERAEELSRGIGYLNPGSADRRQTEGKLTLVRLLKVMVDNDGRLSGSPQIDQAVRTALIPRLKDSVPGSSEGLTSTASLTYSSTSDLHNPPREAPIAVTTLRPSALDKIQEFLLRGERRKAYHYALDEKLWAHAMIIASSIDKDAWKEAVHDFLKTELGIKDDNRRTNGRESLRVAYSLFSGQGVAAVQELLPPNALSRPGGNLQVPSIHATPVSPNFPPPSVTGNIPIESLSSWSETVAMIISSPMTPESSSALTALGDYLLANHWTEAAHACYLLAPQTSQVGGVGAPSVRIVLLGSQSPQVWPGFHKDPDAIIFSEIAEFAFSLTTNPKGQDPFGGLPHLQAYRLIRAASLAEIGHVQLANRYCEAISGSLTRNSPYISAPFVEQLRGLTDRLTGAPHIDKTGSWIGGKMSKPSLDSIGNWLEGRFTKFIAGEGDASPPPTKEPVPSEKPAYVGPFSHYSTISSATPSASPSPQPSITNVNVLPNSPPLRSGSAMALHSGIPSYAQIDRASSAMDYSRPQGRKGSPGPRIASANAATTTFSQSRSFGQLFGAYNPPKASTPSETTTPTQNCDTIDERGDSQEATWWGSSNSEETNATPTAASFLRVDDTLVNSFSDGFISLMDDATITVTPSSPLKNQSRSSYDEHDEEDDLGLGNSKRDHNQKPDDQSKSTSDAGTERKPPAETVPDRPELKPVTTRSWIDRLWRRGESSPGPVKASLGEETTFYYDKELKRWVNKKAGDNSATPSTPPPPPSRAQTTSPGRGGVKPPIGNGPPSSGPPPARPASAIDLTTSPPTKTMPPRARSNLVPSSETESAPTTPLPSGVLQPPPPPSRPKSQASSKRNVRSRYVDVFQQPGPSV